MTSWSSRDPVFLSRAAEDRRAVNGADHGSGAVRPRKFFGGDRRDDFAVPISLVLFRSSFIGMRERFGEGASRRRVVILDVFSATGTLRLTCASWSRFRVGGAMAVRRTGCWGIYVRKTAAEFLPALRAGARIDVICVETGAIDARKFVSLLNGTPHIPALYACQPDSRFEQSGMKRSALSRSR